MSSNLGHLHNRKVLKQVVEKKYDVLDFPGTVEGVVNMIVDNFYDLDREVFISINLDKNNVPINFSLQHMGALNRSVVHPREVFKNALFSGASKMVIMHNHPGNTLRFSSADINLTNALIKAAETINIEILDHYVFTPKKEIISINGKTVGLEKENYQMALFVNEGKDSQIPDVRVRQNIFSEDLIKLTSPDSLVESIEGEFDQKKEVLFSFINTQGEIVSYSKLDYEKTITEGKWEVDKVIKEAILNNAMSIIIVSNNNEHQDLTENEFLFLQDMIKCTDYFGIDLVDFLKFDKYQEIFSSRMEYGQMFDYDDLDYSDINENSEEVSFAKSISNENELSL